MNRSSLLKLFGGASAMPAFSFLPKLATIGKPELFKATLTAKDGLWQEGFQYHNGHLLAEELVVEMQRLGLTLEQAVFNDPLIRIFNHGP